MANYAKKIAMDVGGTPVWQSPAPYTANAVTVTDNAVASSIILLNPNTTNIEVGALGGSGIAVRWIPVTENASIAGAHGSIVASGLGANLDHFIPAGTVRQFVVPKETMGTNIDNAQVGSVHGLYQRIARINAGTAASSVLVTEY